MKKILALLGILGATAKPCLAEDMTITEITHYRGAIAHNQITMVLENINGGVHGKYIRMNDGTPITVTGAYNGNMLELIEKRESTGTARINAQRKGTGKIEGTWEDEKEYEFHATPSSKTYRETIAKIASNETSLIISPRNGPDQIIPIDTFTDSLSITFEDFTFDGYTDMRILELEAGGNSSYIYFEYVPATQEFIKAKPEIYNLINPLIIHGKKLITGLSKDGCCHYSATIIDSDKVYRADYDYISGKGTETVSNRDPELLTDTSISKEVFEEKYLTVIQKGNLQ
jgi:hypothetical protein